jgi:hypothetical protein
MLLLQAYNNTFDVSLCVSLYRPRDAYCQAAWNVMPQRVTAADVVLGEYKGLTYTVDR